ncbi:MAG: 30S ribosomal protein S12 methylthiotransferase RimO, partial [Geobacteraceae bacterium]|nr:30S ribosomal protein S12 methylthiotransferase RimO [Geobacteraceae bacterium]
GACSLLIVCGCLPQRYREELAPQLPEVDVFMGTGDAVNIARIIDTWRSSAPHQLCSIDQPASLYDSDTPRVQASPFYTAYVKIAEGCSNCCSYCIIPELRGPLRSRPIESVATEVEQRVHAGVKEINLIAQDITAYGKDRSDNTTLERLLRRLVEIEGLEWIRLLYAYPEGVSDELIELIATEPKICPYLDMPLQHIADPILEAMNRRLNQADTIALVERIRARIPHITLRTTFIVGFPGETATDFAELHAFASRGLFERVGVFTYSREEGTPAAAYTAQVDEEIKQQRREALMTTLDDIALEKNRTLTGTQTPVLVAGYSEETELLLQGRSITQAPDIDGITYINAGEAEVGEIVMVEITDATSCDLVGHIRGSLDD